MQKAVVFLFCIKNIYVDVDLKDNMELDDL
jgi:hypothetical protein